MKLETQNRRTLMSLAAIAGFSCVALAQGDSLAAPAESMVLSASCPELEAAVEKPTVVRVVAPVRVDWRARVPATIARSRS